MLNDEIGWAAAGARQGLPDGGYIMAIRPHHVTPAAMGSTGVKLTGNVLVTELSGSESIVHFDLWGETWISQAHGIHAIEVGATAAFHLDTDHCMYFDEHDGERAVGDPGQP